MPNLLLSSSNSKLVFQYFINKILDCGSCNRQIKERMWRCRQQKDPCIRIVLSSFSCVSLSARIVQIRVLLTEELICCAHDVQNRHIVRNICAVCFNVLIVFA